MLFAFIPNVQPVTIVVAVTGATLGARAGLACGGAAALLSNAFLGQGPWTPWQMIGWGLVGVTAAPLRHVLRNRYALAAFGIAWGFLFDWLMDVWAWSSLGSGANAGSFLAFVSTGLPFDVAHAAGNAVLALVAGPMLIRMLSRYARRLHPDVQTTGAAMIRRAFVTCTDRPGRPSARPPAPRPAPTTW